MKTIRFLTVMLTALSMGAALAHLLEMPAKLRYDGSDLATPSTDALSTWIRDRRCGMRSFGGSRLVGARCRDPQPAQGVSVDIAWLLVRSCQSCNFLDMGQPSQHDDGPADA